MVQHLAGLAEVGQRRCRCTGCALAALRPCSARCCPHRRAPRGCTTSKALLAKWSCSRGDTGLGGALLGLGDGPALHGFGAAPTLLPAASVWRIAPGDFTPADAALGFLLGAYRFDRLKTQNKKIPAQLTPDAVDDKDPRER